MSEERAVNRSVVAMILVAVLVPQAVAQEPAEPRSALEAAIRRRYVPSNDSTVAVVFSGQPLRRPPRWILDVETGSGHGGSLSFVRLESDGTEVRVEEVAYRCRRDGGRDGVRRARFSEAECGMLIETVCLLPAVTIQETTGPEEEEGVLRPGSHWWSSGDFLVNVRLLDETGAGLLERSYAGYPSSDTQLRYLALERIADLSYELLSRSDRFTSVPEAEHRATHFAAAFALNAELMRSSWWVQEYSVEALAHFGTPDVLPVLRALREGRLLPRQVAKIDALLADPERWLTGPPKVIPDPD